MLSLFPVRIAPEKCCVCECFCEGAFLGVELKGHQPEQIFWPPATLRDMRIQREPSSNKDTHTQSMHPFMTGAPPLTTRRLLKTIDNCCVNLRHITTGICGEEK